MADMSTKSAWRTWTVVAGIVCGVVIAVVLRPKVDARTELYRAAYSGDLKAFRNAAEKVPGQMLRGRESLWILSRILEHRRQKISLRPNV